ncbi:MAG TPA: aspartate aminotransferase family protein [Firmicutes bacterium]|nr:aspartate aminotransferase family protein [Bacillota bacterium]
MSTSQALEWKKSYLFPNVRTYYDKPLVLSRGHGIRVEDQDGIQYLDLFGGILTISVGHAHPQVTDAVCRQVRAIMHTSTCYLNEPLLELAHRLAEMTPGRLQKCFFTNSGTEAIETAVAAARAFTGRQEVIALRHSYHGRSQLAASLTANASWRTPHALPGITYAHNAYCYRCAFGLSYPGCDVACAQDIEELIRTTTVGEVAAFLAEPILGVGGFITPPPEYFQVAVEIVRRHGGVFICDEVQTGFGRTGGHMFGIEHWGVEPELMVFAKGLANGAPIGATIAVPDVADACTSSSISTFGGNPVSMTAALATLEVITSTALPDHVAAMGKLFFDGLRELQDHHPFMGDVRGKGLMIGVELVGENKAPAPDLTTRFLEVAREEGILVGRGGLYSNVVRITPPMTIGEGEVAEALDKVARVCGRLAATA